MRQTAGSSGRARSHRVSQSPASSKRPARVARSARPSQTRSSSGADRLALPSPSVKRVNRIGVVVVAPRGCGGVSEGSTHPFDFLLRRLWHRRAGRLSSTPGSTAAAPPHPCRLLGGWRVRDTFPRAGSDRSPGRVALVTTRRAEPLSPGREHGPRPRARLRRGPGYLTCTEQILDIAPSPPTAGQPGKPRPGLMDPPCPECTLGLAQLVLEVPLPDRPNDDPHPRGKPQAGHQDRESTSHGFHKHHPGPKRQGPAE